MTTGAKFSEVLAAVHEQALHEEGSIEFSRGFIREVESTLLLDFGADGYWARISYDRFCGQVNRALSKLAAEGTLIRTGEGRGGIRYWAPEAYRRHVEEVSAREADKQAALLRAVNIQRRLEKLGVDQILVHPSGALVVEAGTPEGMAALERLLNLAEKESRS